MLKVPLVISLNTANQFLTIFKVIINSFCVVLNCLLMFEHFVFIFYTNNSSKK